MQKSDKRYGEGGEFLNKKIMFMVSLAITSVILFMSVWLVIGYSERNSHVPTEWQQTTIGSSILTEQWDWDWTNYQTSGPWASGGPPYILYKMVGDALFLTYPSGPLIVADRVGQANTWIWSGGGTAKGGPGGNTVLMSTTHISITITYEDIPQTEDDNDYKGLRMIFESWQDLYRLVNVGSDNYVWQGFVHQHFVSWAAEGSKA